MVIWRYYMGLLDPSSRLHRPCLELVPPVLAAHLNTPIWTHLNLSQPISTHLPIFFSCNTFPASSWIPRPLPLSFHFFQYFIWCLHCYLCAQFGNFCTKINELVLEKEKIEVGVGRREKRDREHTWTHGVVNRGLRIVHIHQRWANSGFFLLQIQIRILFGSVNLTKYKHEY